MKLQVKFLKWSAGIPVAILNEKTASQIGVRAQDRIAIETNSGNPKKFFTIIDTVKSLAKEGEIIVSSELKEMLNLKENQEVDVNIASLPKSILSIQKKLNKQSLNEVEIAEIIKDITNNFLSEAEIALFVSAMYKQGMTMKETIFLIKAILKTGKTLKFKGKYVADKHSIGGIPGNRTTPLVVSICVAAGLTMPKSSSRAITTSAGTADVIETIARVDFTREEIKKIVQKTNACLVWGGGLGLVPADSKIIRIEKTLKIDPEAQLLASIMAKKIAMGSKYILIDIPYGVGAKVTKERGLKLKKKFEYLGKYFNKKLICILTDGSQPIGNGVGPALELLDILKILDPTKRGPRDLEDKALLLSGKLLEMTGKAKKGKGPILAMDMLDSGKALEKFKEIIKAQGGNINRIPIAKYSKTIFFKKSGKIIQLENKLINSLARVLGCPADKAAGLYLYHHVGDEVKKKDKFVTLFSESKQRLKEGIKFLKQNQIVILR